MEFKEIKSILRTPQGNYLVCLFDGDNVSCPGIYREVLVLSGQLGSFIEEYFCIPDWKGGSVNGESEKDAKS